MTDAARAWVTAFESLPPADQKEVLTAILRQSAAADGSLEEDLLAAADELFQSYDAEEAARAGS